LQYHFQFIQKEVYKYNVKDTTTLQLQLKFTTTLIHIPVLKKDITPHWSRF